MAGEAARRRAMAWLMVRRSLTRRHSRMVVAVLAVTVGGTTLFALATLALNLPTQLSSDLRNYGANLVVVPEGEAISATQAEALGQALAPAPVVFRADFSYAAGQLDSQPVTLAGVDFGQARTAKGYWDVEGTWPAQAGEVLVGRDAAKWLELAVGDQVSLQGAAAGQLTVKVSAVVTSGGVEDGFVVLALSDWEVLTGHPAEFDLIELSLAVDEATLAVWVDQLNDQVAGVKVTAVKRLAHTEADVVAMVRLLLGLVAGLVLALSLIGSATTMMAVVAERRGEIALVKALGAADRSIRRQFIAEGFFIGLAGGLGGVILGFILAQVVSQAVFQRSVAIAWELALATVLAAVTVTYLACWGPVNRAGRIDPALQLREE